MPVVLVTGSSETTMGMVRQQSWGWKRGTGHSWSVIRCIEATILVCKRWTHFPGMGLGAITSPIQGRPFIATCFDPVLCSVVWSCCRKTCGRNFRCCRYNATKTMPPPSTAEDFASVGKKRWKMEPESLVQTSFPVRISGQKQAQWVNPDRPRRYHAVLNPVYCIWRFP
jgi:hypothetical protein